MSDANLVWVLNKIEYSVRDRISPSGNIIERVDFCDLIDAYAIRVSRAMATGWMPEEGDPMLALEDRFVGVDIWVPLASGPYYQRSLKVSGEHQFIEGAYFQLNSGLVVPRILIEESGLPAINYAFVGIMDAYIAPLSTPDNPIFD